MWLLMALQDTAKLWICFEKSLKTELKHELRWTCLKSPTHSDPHTCTPKQMKTSLFISVSTERAARGSLHLLFHTAAVHSQWNYHFITASLPSNSYIFCTSDPHHMDRATSTDYLSCYLCPSEPIFRKLARPLGCEWFLHVGLHGLFI